MLLPWLLCVVLAPAAGSVAVEWSPDPQAERVGDRPPTGEDLLGEIAVEAAKDTRPGEAPLIPITLRIDGPPRPRVEVRRILERDLGLFGRFALQDDLQRPSEELHGQLVHISISENGAGWSLVATTDAEAQPIHLDVPRSDRLRPSTHMLADAIIGALTGSPGPFHSSLGFVATGPGPRRAQLADADGTRLRWLSPADELASTVGFDPSGQAWYASSRGRGRFQLRTPTHRTARIDPDTSVYGIAFAPGRDTLAVALAIDENIELWTGPSSSLRLGRRKTRGDTVLQPALGPAGEIAYVAGARDRRRVYVNDRPISDPSRDASSPSFCPHPGGTKVVWVERRGRQAKLVVASVDGSNRRELATPGPEIGASACSPDGRLVAFFVRRPAARVGLWVGNLERFRPQKLADVRGDQLHWSPRVRS